MTNVIKVGDLVYYKPTIDIDMNQGIYSWNYEYATSLLNGKKIIKNTDWNFKINLWRVFRITKDVIELVPYKVRCGKVKLQGPQGYNNATYLLNDICNKLYGDNKNNITARSINIDDLESILNVNIIKKNTIDFNKQAKDKYTLDNSWYPIIYEYEGNGVIDGKKKTNNIIDKSESYKELINRKDEGKKQPNKYIWSVKTYYNTIDYNNTYNLFRDNKYANILIPNKNRTDYWIASRCIGFGEICAHYDIRMMYKGYIRAARMYASDDVIGLQKHHLFPIVSVNKIKLEYVKDKGDTSVFKIINK